MTATNLNLVGENKWGQMASRRIYRDDSGRMYVKEQTIGSLRCNPLPYKQYADKYFEYSYIMERK